MTTAIDFAKYAPRLQRYRGALHENAVQSQYAELRVREVIEKITREAVADGATVTIEGDEILIEYPKPEDK